MGSLGLAPLLFALQAFAATQTEDTGTTPATVDTDTTTTTTTTTTGDTGYCAECLDAADLAGEQGGSPCQDGCSASGGPSSFGGFVLFGLLALRRRSR